MPPRAQPSDATPAPSALSAREEAFVALFVVLRNGAEAARKAGYAEKSARYASRRLLERAHVQAAIAAAEQAVAAQRDVATAKVIDAAADAAQTEADAKAYVVATLREVVERCMQRAPVMVRGEGGALVQATDEEGRHVWEFDAKNAVAAAAWIGREAGMFVKRVSVDKTVRRLVVELRDEGKTRFQQEQQG